jgi:sugar lactone lactonase YvrE
MLAALALLLGAAAAAPAAAPAAAAPGKLPSEIPLPDGFQPEGIAIDRDGTFYAGSIPTGAVFRGDVRTGEGDVLVPGEQGRAAIGLKVSRGRLFVAGGPTGRAFVYSARSGRLLASYQLATGNSFVNDVVVTRKAAWFTDSFNQVLYRVPLGRHGRLAKPDEVTTLPLTGDIRFQEGFNTNGIEAAKGGRVLLISQTNAGKLFTVDPRSGVTREIDLGGETVAGDGLLLRGRTLYAVEGFNGNVVTRLRLGRGLATARVVERIGDPDFDIPTTIAAFRGRLYVVNSRFTTPPTPDTEYSVVRVDRR